MNVFTEQAPLIKLLMRLNYTILTADFDPWALRAKKILISPKSYTPDPVLLLIGFGDVTVRACENNIVVKGLTLAPCTAASVHVYICNQSRVQDFMSTIDLTST